MENSYDTLSKANVYKTGYDKNKLHFIEGKVEDTLPQNTPESLSILRIDVDFYSPTKHALQHLFPRLSVGGALILDDYGVWRGARQAVDEYIAENNIPILLQRTSFTQVMGIKIR